MDAKERAELVAVITNFLELGHAENIAAMFRKDPGLYALTGELLRDDRFAVRLGLAVCFEELVEQRPTEAAAAVPTLVPLLASRDPRLRGEAATLLGIIGTPEALAGLAPLLVDPDPQVREIAADLLDCPSAGNDKD